MMQIRLPKRRILITVVMLAIVLPLGTYVALRGGYARSATVGSNASLEVELITLRPAGFEPLEISRTKDPFVLFVDDRSGKETKLVLQSVKGEKLRAIDLNRKRSEWHDVLDLSPGSYVLQDASNPQLRCQIKIMP